jgi:hypothetical protein
MALVKASKEVIDPSIATSIRLNMLFSFMCTLQSGQIT